MRLRLALAAFPVLALLAGCGDPVGTYFPAEGDAAAPDADVPPAVDAGQDARVESSDAGDGGSDADAGQAGDAGDAGGGCLEAKELWIDTPEAAAGLAGVACVVGHVVVTGGAAVNGVVVLPALERVDGSLLVSGYAGTSFVAPKLAAVRDTLDLLTRGVVQAPALVDVGSLVIEGPTVADLPALTHAKEVTIQDQTAAVLVPQLASVDASMVIEGASALGSFAAHALTTVGGELRVETNAKLAALSFDALQSAAAVWMGGDPSLASLDLSALARIDGAASFGLGGLYALALPSLAKVGGTLAIVGDASGAGVLASVRLPQLATADAITIEGTDATELALPALMSTAAQLAITGHPKLQRVVAPRMTSCGGQLAIIGDPALTSVDFGSLAYAKSLAVNGANALADLSGFPALAELGMLDLSFDAKLAVHGLDALSTAQVVRLDGLGGASLLDLPQLATITTRLYVATTLAATSLGHLPKLARIGAIDVEKNFTLTSLGGLEALRAVDGAITIAGNDALADVDALAGVTQVGGAIAITGPALDHVRLSALPAVDALTIDGAPKLTRIDVSALARVRRFEADLDPALLELVAPALTAVDEEVRLTNDGALSACVASRLRMQVQAAGGDPARVVASGLASDPACP